MWFRNELSSLAEVSLYFPGTQPVRVFTCSLERANDRSPKHTSCAPNTMNKVQSLKNAKCYKRPSESYRNPRWHFCITLPVQSDWLQSLRTNQFTYYIKILYLIWLLHVSTVVILRELKTKQLKSHSSKLALSKVLVVKVQIMYGEQTKYRHAD